MTLKLGLTAALLASVPTAQARLGSYGRTRETNTYEHGVPSALPDQETEQVESSSTFSQRFWKFADTVLPIAYGTTLYAVYHFATRDIPPMDEKLAKQPFWNEESRWSTEPGATADNDDSALPIHGHVRDKSTDYRLQLREKTRSYEEYKVTVTETFYGGRAKRETQTVPAPALRRGVIHTIGLKTRVLKLTKGGKFKVLKARAVEPGTEVKQGSTLRKVPVRRDLSNLVHFHIGGE